MIDIPGCSEMQADKGLQGDKTYNILFVETPRKLITAKLSIRAIRKPGSYMYILLALMKIRA
jgi:hypothetical protein